MTRMLARIAVGLTLLASPAVLCAQTFEEVGTRAAGMGGAFVGVADDASAAYWNPAGFAAGSFLSLVIDRTGGKANPPDLPGGSGRSGLLFALGAPPLGLSYYSLRATTLTSLPTVQGAAVTTPGIVRVNTLSTHHTGVTLVQSLTEGVAVGATLKLVRGSASSSLQTDEHRDSLLDGDSDPRGRESTKFDADLGLMATLGRVKAGLTVRNATEPGFKTDGHTPSLTLQRQARAGLSVTPRPGWIVAADLDLNRVASPFGDMRAFAAGAEGHVHPKVFVRGGLRVNTAGSRAPAVSAGASYAATGSLLIDAQVTGGSAQAARGWGVAARFGY
ncbi:MAG: conjugal transfer protein TraF [Acidobacteriota bacterium]